MKRLLSILLVLAMILTACSGGTTTPDPVEKPTDEKPAEDVTEGGKYAAEQVYKTVYAEEVTTMNYLVTNTNVDMLITANLVDSLVDYDRYGVIQPGLAETWESSEEKVLNGLILKEMK